MSDAEQQTSRAAPATQALPARPRRRFTRRTIAISAAASAIVSIGVWAWLGRTSAPDYVTATVTRGDVVRTVTASGTVNPQTTVQVGTYVSGPIQALYGDYNTPVHKGQLLAKIDPTPARVVGLSPPPKPGAAELGAGAEAMAISSGLLPPRIGLSGRIA